ncbi:hypothetical protein [Proteiniphilum sp. X52]|uniref:hypothetical protein n=1 Tax=Proteiniphilum sp. X52 TaxID=2382159 RepID=UPI0011CD92DE|nr:hypothetical protein [Proteiniphilum sp. X52]
MKTKKGSIDLILSLDNIVLSNDDLIEIKGGKNDTAGCGVGCGAGCGGGCSGCSQPDEPVLV